MEATRRWDVFCTVIDNYGDIGITWRLARQLALEHGIAVRLWVDDLESFRRLCPEVFADRDYQTVAGVEIHRWRIPFPDIAPGNVVIEALACHLPENLEHAMARQAIKPVWVNLEYLSAEDWVVGCHGLPSRHPRLPLTKYFFMPGYVEATGGVLKEHWLDARRKAFLADRAARDAFWDGLALPPESADESRISLFCYESPEAITSLFEAWSGGAESIRCLVPQGKATADVARFFGESEIAPGNLMEKGSLTVHTLPMLDMDGYDHLLWACDCNFVRGEDSFVRAQWAGKPLVWQAYRQSEGAHWAKIEAFLRLYCADMAPGDAEALGNLWRLWNEVGEAGTAWPAFWAHRAELAASAATWRTRLEAVGDLANNLVKFCNEKSK